MSFNRGKLIPGIVVAAAAGAGAVGLYNMPKEITEGPNITLNNKTKQFDAKTTENAWLKFYNKAFKTKLVNNNETQNVKRINKTTVVIFEPFQQTDKNTYNDNIINRESNIIKILQSLSNQKVNLDKITNNGKILVAFTFGEQDKIVKIRGGFIVQISFKNNKQSDNNINAFVTQSLNSLIKTINETNHKELSTTVTPIVTPVTQYLKNNEPKTAPTISSEPKKQSEMKGDLENYNRFVQANPDYMEDDEFMTSRFITAVIDGVEGKVKVSPVQMQAIAEGHILGSKNGVVKLDRATSFHGDGLSRQAYLNGETNGDSLPNSGLSSTSFLRHEELFEIFSTKFLANLTTPKHAKYKNYSMEQFKNMNKTIEGRKIILDIVENARSSEAGKTRWIDHVLEYETGVLGKELKDSLEATKKNGIILKDMNFFKKNPKAANIVKLFIADTYNQNGERRSQKFLKILNATKDLYFNDKSGNADYVNWIIRAKMMYYNPNPTIPTSLADAERCASIDTSEATGLTGPIRVATVFENGKFGQRDLNIDKNSPKEDGFNKQQHAQIVRADVVRRTKEIVNAVNGSVFDVFNWWKKSKDDK